MVSKGPEAARQRSAACGIGGIAPDADARLLSGPLASRLILLQAVQAGPELQPFLTEASSCCRFIRSDHVGINRLQFLLDSLTDLDKRCMTAAACAHRRSPSKPTFRVATSVHLIRACLICVTLSSQPASARVQAGRTARQPHGGPAKVHEGMGCDKAVL